MSKTSLPKGKRRRYYGMIDFRGHVQVTEHLILKTMTQQKIVTYYISKLMYPSMVAKNGWLSDQAHNFFHVGFLTSS